MHSLKSKSSNWLDAHSDQNMVQYTLPSCLTLCDLKSDNYYKLILADIPKDICSKSKLKVFKGIGMINEQGLPGIPSGIESFYIDETEPKMPMIAVAIGPSVLFYRNMKPYYKYTIPGLNVEPLETQIWRKLDVERPENHEALIEDLKSIEISQLTWKSQKLLFLPAEERQIFIKENIETELQRLSIITAMTTLQHTTSDDKPPSSLVLATEDGEILIIDTQTFVVIYRAKVCSFTATPSLISAMGHFNTDFRIVIATRERSLCLLRKMWLEGKEIFKMEYPAIALAFLPIDQTIIVACMGCNLTCYSKKGKLLWIVKLSSIPKCMTTVHLPHLGKTLIAVAFKNSKVQLYLHKNVVDEFQTKDPITAMIFGRLGQEEHVLTLITDQGTLLVKILKRTAEFNVPDLVKQKRSLENIRNLEIPKKSSIFLEQLEREKKNAKNIYHSFQTELWRLRLTAARATVDVINSSESTISGDLKTASIRLAAEVCGLGPQFRLFLTIENMSDKQEATDISVLLHADQRHYTLNKPMTTLPTLLPHLPIKIDFEVNAVLDPNDNLPPPDLNQENSIVRIMIFKIGEAKPLIAAIVSMPESEAPLEN